MNWVTQTGLSKQVRLELEKFFAATAERQSKTRECLGWRGPKKRTPTDQELGAEISAGLREAGALFSPLPACPGRETKTAPAVRDGCGQCLAILFMNEPGEQGRGRVFISLGFGLGSSSWELSFGR